MAGDEKINEFAAKIFSTIEGGITDITKLDVTTMVADAAKIDAEKAFEKDLNFAELEGTVDVVGVTRLDVDGDITELLHDSEGKLTLDPELLAIHKESVDRSEYSEWFL